MPAAPAYLVWSIMATLVSEVLGVTRAVADKKAVGHIPRLPPLAIRPFQVSQMEQWTALGSVQADHDRT
jgi:hypothetical protein